MDTDIRVSFGCDATARASSWYEGDVIRQEAEKWLGVLLDQIKELPPGGLRIEFNARIDE